MKTWGTVVGLIVFLLVLASPWTVGPAAAQSPASLRAFAFIKFDVEPVRAAAHLWDDANYLKSADERWRNPLRRESTARRPTRTAAVMNITLVRAIGIIDTRVRGRTGVAGTWDAIALVRASSEEDLRLIEIYIESGYSHVDIYRIDEGS